MTVEDIIKQVRWCIDEEAVDLSGISGADENDDAYMDNIIKAKMDDALRWCLLYAPQELLTGSATGGNTSDYVVSNEYVSFETADSGSPSTVTLPEGFTRLVRVRLAKWARAVRIPIEEDSDEYLALSDDTAKATNDRPVAALIRTSPRMKLELWPGGNAQGLEITIVNSPSSAISEDSSMQTVVNIPEKLRTAFIYYIAFLVCAAYREGAATTMLEIAKMNLGLK
jgi:hypothetical protein